MKELINLKDKKSNNFLHIMMKNIEPEKQEQFLENMIFFFNLENKSQIYDKIKDFLDSKNDNGFNPLEALL